MKEKLMYLPHVSEKMEKLKSTIVHVIIIESEYLKPEISNSQCSVNTSLMFSCILAQQMLLIPGKSFLTFTCSVSLSQARIS